MRRTGGKLYNWHMCSCGWLVIWLKPCLVPGSVISPNSRLRQRIKNLPLPWCSEISDELFRRLGHQPKLPNPVVNPLDEPREIDKSRENVKKSSKSLYPSRHRSQERHKMVLQTLSKLNENHSQDTSLFKAQMKGSTSHHSQEC